MVESTRRSLLKSVTWRLTALIVLGLISYRITGNWEEMTAITAIYTALQVVTYFTHERLWTRIAWGRKQHPLADIPVDGPLDPSDLKVVEEQLRALGYMS
ncbi:MAG: DUF2061 domain-containing protein [Anaerolineales bacterium]|nr:MAG: DUF2061 domain-containing protein [Anaerolineales bacterium]